MESKSRAVAICALAVIVSLYIVGLVTHGIIRHVVQTAPVWIAVWLGFQRSPWTKWTALAPLALWFLLMVNIWMFLLGLPHLLSGTFTPIEVVLTITTGVGALIGTVFAARVRTAVPWMKAVGTLVLMAGLQFLALWISFQRGVSRDPW
ncbi:MAG TPA: hypothetical protein VL382_10960 [Terriglobales bacterium]|nr:hypothetical protein [Terriglobales bacterium]